MSFMFQMQSSRYHEVRNLILSCSADWVDANKQNATLVLTGDCTEPRLFYLRYNISIYIYIIFSYEEFKPASETDQNVPHHNVIVQGYYANLLLQLQMHTYVW